MVSESASWEVRALDPFLRLIRWVWRYQGVRRSAHGICGDPLSRLFRSLVVAFKILRSRVSGPERDGTWFSVSGP